MWNSIPPCMNPYLQWHITDIMYQHYEDSHLHHVDGIADQQQGKGDRVV